jgi:hypothetical protein
MSGHASEVIREYPEGQSWSNWPFARLQGEVTFEKLHELIPLAMVLEAQVGPL